MSTKMTPQLRFPEFTDEWQVKKLGDITKIFDGTHQTPKYVEAGVPFFSVEHVTSNDFSNTKFISEEVFQKEKNKPERGDILMTRIGDIGTARYVNWDTRASFYVSLALIKGSNEYDGTFLEKYIATSQFQNELWRRTLHVAFPKKINLGDISQCQIKLPSKPEQEKIADFLTAVDERIAVGEKKLELLEAYERGVMQKIFSQKIRFKDENGKQYPDWKEKKLSDVLKERNTQTPISGEYPLMAFVAYKGVAPKGDRYNREFLVSDAKSKKYKQTQLGDFIYSSNNLETGSIGSNLYGSASISPVYSIFETKDGYSHQFLGAYLTRKKFIYQMVRYRQGVVYGQWRIHESEFLKIEEKFPCTGEQQKIADFLTTLGEKITAEKSKLTATRQFKKALLQRMFV